MRGRAAVSSELSLIATLADAVHRICAKPTGRRFTRSLCAGCGFQAGTAAMSRFGSTCRGDELRKDGGNGEGQHLVRRRSRDTGSES